METRRIREVAVRSQAEVAELLSIVEGRSISQVTVARAEREAFRKLRANPEARLLLRYISSQNSQPFSATVEPEVMRKLGSIPEDTRFLSISGFAPNL